MAKPMSAKKNASTPRWRAAKGMGSAAVHLRQELGVATGSINVASNANKNERRSEPDGQLMGLVGDAVLDELDFLQEEAEARHDKTESHEREARANPGEEGTLFGKVVGEAGGSLRLRGRVHGGFLGRARSR
jgi:hypothetical protein